MSFIIMYFLRYWNFKNQNKMILKYSVNLFYKEKPLSRGFLLSQTKHICSVINILLLSAFSFFDVKLYVILAL